MSDLFCPATLILARHSEVKLADYLRGRNVAHVYSSTMIRAVQTAETVAETLNLDITVKESLREAVAQEGSGDLVARCRAVIEELSDVHRGETVLVVTHSDVLDSAVPALAMMASGVGRVPHPGLVELQVDADGIVCTAWAPSSSYPPREAID
ncbi:histidine phosphatase family protein [Demetria terragena]|uniref:histidine phosphatase family protein n=1 Tax=Demetria terragena TaxID=63959 RepID=UPI0003617446|nr:histidine phosphatase family protein [Demetria terragena]